MPDVRIRYAKAVTPNDLHPDGQPKGAEYDVASAALARKFHPDAEIVGTVGPLGIIEPIDAPKAAASPTPKAAPADKSAADKPAADADRHPFVRSVTTDRTGTIDRATKV